MSAIRPSLQLFPQILTMDEVSKIGKISKQWTGLLREAFTDSDNFGIQFPMDLDVRMKAVMIGACFLIVSATIYVFDDTERSITIFVRMWLTQMY